MRRQVPVHQQLYHYLFPTPSHGDPPSFTAHLARNLVPEVRIEVAAFYGDLNSVEARYPGLDYCSAPHRLRLGRFKHHRRLFRAFDALGLTEQEIQELCCWEGSKWARQKYEEDQGIRVMDTTGDDIGPWVDPRHMSTKQKSKLPPSRKLLKSEPIPNDNKCSQAIFVVPAQREPSIVHHGYHDELPHALPPPIASTGYPPHLEQQLDVLQRQVAQALLEGRDLSPDIEALVKHHVERGELPERFFAYAREIAEHRRRQAAIS